MEKAHKTADMTFPCTHAKDSLFYRGGTMMTAPRPTTTTTTTYLAPVTVSHISREILFQNALHIAAGAGNLVGVNFCLRAGIDVNFPASNGAAPILFAAAFCREMAVFERLAEAGADLKVSDRSASPPWTSATGKRGWPCGSGKSSRED